MHDHYLFIKTKGSIFLVVLVYVDDVLVTGSDDLEIQSLKTYLNDLFTIKDLGFANYFLGIELACNAQGIFLSQRKYILDILQDICLTGCKLASAPLPQGIKLSG